MMSVTSPALASARPMRLQRRVDGAQVVDAHVRQHQVLLVRDAHLVEGVALGEIGDRRPSGRRVASPGMPPIGFSEMVTMA